MYQRGTATDYQNLLSQLVQIVTATHISAVAIAAGGSGYVVGDVLTLSGGTGTHSTTVEVTSVAAGVVDGILLRDGGAYSVVPTSPASTTGGTGTGCTITVSTSTSTGWTANRDTTYTYDSITEKEILLEGAGLAGADEIFVGIKSYSILNDITRSYLWHLNGMTGYNSGLAYASQPGISPASSPSTGGGCYVPLENASMDFWFFITGRRIMGIVKTSDVTTTHYMSFFLGLVDPFQTSTEYPYPMFISGCSARQDALWDTTIPDVAGLTEQIGIGSRTGPGYTRLANGTWQSVSNSRTSFSGSVSRAGTLDYTIYPAGKNRNLPGGDDDIVGDAFFDFEDLFPNSGVPGAPSFTLQPSPDSGGDLYLLIPATLIWTGPSDINRQMVGHLPGVYAVGPGGVLTSEDTITQGSDEFTVFAGGQRTQACSYMAIKME
jgi:hypothetical protein